MSTLAIMTKKLISLGQARAIRYLGALVNIDDLLASLSAKPTHLGIEVANICNANCVFCAYQYVERPKVVLLVCQNNSRLANSRFCRRQEPTSGR